MNLQVRAQDARNNFADMLNRAVYGQKPVVITRFNKPAAVLMDYVAYERLMNPSLRFTGNEWEKGFAVFDQIRAKTKGLSPASITSVVNQAVADVRRKNRGTRSR